MVNNFSSHILTWMNTRKKWQEAELLTKNYLTAKGYQIIDQNYTIRWGELDIIAEKKDIRIFIEVKEVDHILDLHDYITSKKIATLTKTIGHFNQEYPTKKQLRIDLVFVKQNNILHHYENITNN